MRRARGFTLVELLVSLFILAVLAGLSWRGIDGMVRARQQTEVYTDQVLGLQTGLAQWGADLDAIMELPGFTALQWNGRVLRLTRHSSTSPGDGARVVGWALRGGQWRRWESPPLYTRGDVDAAWQQADLWSQTPSDAMQRQEVVIAPLEDWQIFYFRNNSWTNPQSSPDSTQTTAALAAAAAASGAVATAAAVQQAQATTSALPDGVRLVLQLPAGRAIAGRLQRDWIRPTLGPS
ncbi:prepilin-type N-terminal cleavage/methylation domain-containing protein [Ramlibacter sp.]|uniref:PulJ/GspJ family protein n=1 Tax=Ramlibacter sp. TaxID=1917967 RepID=UPI0026151EDB|nr:prepilin-type N-terminal cleavage/methylation domain-containing protein [Ramlibacter sp.]MDB5957245.1 methylation [Ramlibacter sp.]